MFKFLKEKLKKWLGKSKKIIEETPEKEKKKKKEKKEIKKKIKEKRQKKHERIIEEFPEIKEHESAIEVEQEIEEGVTEKNKKEIEKVEYKIQKEISTREAPTFEEIKSERQKRGGFFARLKSKFSYNITQEKFNEIFNDLEFLLIENNVALEPVENIKSKLSEKLIGKEISKDKVESEIMKELKLSLNEILIEPDDPLDAIKEKKSQDKKPFVILFFGINGTGKTTTIAKFAHLLKKNDFSVVMAASDTFRAASIEQIQIHADKLKVKLIKHDYGADPSAVAYDAIEYAKKHHIDVVLIDTAGRMHTKTNLIDEMEKISRVTNPDLKIFVAESIAGNDAVEQAQTFNEAIEIDGSILSKADIDEKGGTIISVSYATHKPIFYLGTGQKYDDLKLFNKEKFLGELLG